MQGNVVQSGNTAFERAKDSPSQKRSLNRLKLEPITPLAPQKPLPPYRYRISRHPRTSLKVEFSRKIVSGLYSCKSATGGVAKNNHYWQAYSWEHPLPQMGGFNIGHSKRTVCSLKLWLTFRLWTFTIPISFPWYQIFAWSITIQPHPFLTIPLKEDQIFLLKQIPVGLNFMCIWNSYNSISYIAIHQYTRRYFIEKNPICKIHLLPKIYGLCQLR